MIETVFRTGDDFKAKARMLDLGTVQVPMEIFPSLRVERTPKLIRQSDPEQYHLTLSLRGDFGLAHAGREALITPGDLLLFDSSRPLSGWTTADDTDLCSDLRIQFPKTSLPFRPDQIEPFIARPLPCREGIGAVLSTCLRELTAGTAKYGTADVSRLTTIALDLLTALLAHELDSQNSLPQETHNRALLARIHDFIDQNLADPDLSPATIAAAHHISTRHLHRLFQDQGLTVAARIRRRRLEHCHRDLTDPRLLSLPINGIAARWGFPDNARFSRLFRATYGLSPRDHRAMALKSRGCDRSTLGSPF
ncbi:helix-turn-helix domain-containing protein [Actinokineospora soli]|uniref:Helix-turn-helix domain-containing protein n=1 Tax=Actinokineospora soli TaxID=1048753 RepID=A0ABW2TKY1_9PSEU